ncbi:MAG: hypothetical protein EOM24_26610 [Chloroflexia bacterium]|nr:hypothetical protein [Chloroflexia bacterium]
MTSQGNRDVGPDQPTLYQIRLRGHLGSQWAAWFDGMTVDLTNAGDTLLTGPIADQAALHGLLRKVRDLGLTLLAVQCIPGEATSVVPDEGAATQPPEGA